MPPYATQNLITVSGFKARNPEVDVSSWDDTTISGFISRATRMMLNYCEVDDFLSRTVSGEQGYAAITAVGDLVIFPRVRPITASGISAIRLVKGGFSTTLTLSGSGQTFFQVPYPYVSLVYPSSYLAGAGTLMIGGSAQLVTLRGAGLFYQLDYTGGYSPAQIPEDLQDACDLYVRDILTRRLNPLGAQEVRQGSFSYSRSIRSSNPRADMVNSLYVQQAREILNNGGYRRVALG